MKLLIQKFKKIFFSDICTMCLKQLESNENYLCKDCIDYLKDNSSVKNKGNFYYIYYYNEKIRKLIGDYKLKNRKGLSIIMSDILKEKISDIILKNHIDVVIPVPISKKRQLERGFNQVEEILICSNIKFYKIFRIKETDHMYNLKSKEDREENIKEVFKVDIDLNNKSILVVDDILTTGATVKEIVKEIRKTYRVKKIYVFTISVVNNFLLKEPD